MPYPPSYELQPDFDLKESGESASWKIVIGADIGASPVQRIPLPEVFYNKSAPLRYYCVNQFTITHKTTDKILDVLALTPPSWSHQLVLPEDQEDIETAMDLHHFIFYDEHNREMAWGKGLLSTTAYGGFDQMPKHMLTSLLWTRFLENVAQPVTLPAAHSMSDTVTQQVTTILRAWQDPNDQRPIDQLVKEIFPPSHPTT
ncbi:MAG: hypothetical protein V1487_00615 [bacterium]